MFTQFLFYWYYCYWYHSVDIIYMILFFCWTQSSLSLMEFIVKISKLDNEINKNIIIKDFAESLFLSTKNCLIKAIYQLSGLELGFCANCLLSFMHRTSFSQRSGQFFFQVIFDIYHYWKSNEMHENDGISNSKWD